MNTTAWSRLTTRQRTVIVIAALCVLGIFLSTAMIVSAGWLMWITLGGALPAFAMGWAIHLMRPPAPSIATPPDPAGEGKS